MGIKAFLLTAQLRWISHVIRMGDSRIPKMTTVSWKMAYALMEIWWSDAKTCWNSTSKLVQFHLNNLSCLYKTDQTGTHTAGMVFLSLKLNVWNHSKKKQQTRKERQHTATGCFPCDACQRLCTSHLWLFAHQNSHQPTWTLNLSCWWPSLSSPSLSSSSVSKFLSHYISPQKSFV